MTLQQYDNNIKWYPLIWIGLLLVSPFLIRLYEDVSILSTITVLCSLLSVALQYVEMKFKTISIQDNTLKINKVFGKKEISISELKYAKILDNKGVKRTLFGSGKQSVEIYGKWGFEILDVEQPELLLEELKLKSEHFN